MALTGIDPARRTPASLRELRFAQGSSSGGGAERTVLLFANKTSAGTETVDVIGTPIADRQDCIDRFGRRSEAHLMYRTLLAADPSAAQATVRIVAPTESAGTATTRTITFATTASGTTTCFVDLIGERVGFTVTTGDVVATIATNCAAAINAADSGNWPVTASAALGVVTVTAANIGPRGDYVLGTGTNIGLRCSFAKDVTTTITVAAITAGTTEDDFTAAYAEMAQGEYYYQVSPKFSTSGPTATDNGVGEHIANIVTGNLPINGKSQLVIFGLVGTQANATTVGTDTDANSVFAYFFHAKNSDWTPGMIAAHCAGVMRSQWARHPAWNLAGYANSDETPWRIPAPYSNANRLTAVEIESDLKDGVSPIGVNPAGGTYLVRQITSRNLNTQGSKDYRASEGHIPSAVHAFWARVKQVLAEQKQPFVDSDPVAGQKPAPNTWYPNSIKSILSDIINDFTGPKPLGRYDGPILKQSARDAMKASIVPAKIPGGISVTCDVQAVEHYLFGETTINETGGAY